MSSACRRPLMPCPRPSPCPPLATHLPLFPASFRQLELSDVVGAEQLEVTVRDWNRLGKGKVIATAVVRRPSTLARRGLFCSPAANPSSCWLNFHTRPPSGASSTVMNKMYAWRRSRLVKLICASPLKIPAACLVCPLQTSAAAKVGDDVFLEADSTYRSTQSRKRTFTVMPPYFSRLSQPLRPPRSLHRIALRRRNRGAGLGRKNPYVPWAPLAMLAPAHPPSVLHTTHRMWASIA